MSMVGTAEIGTTHTASMSTNYGGQYVSIWIDINQDLEFTDDELVLADHVMEDEFVFNNVDVTIPGYTFPGETVMRIGANCSEPSSPDPCATFVYGAWEDYTLDLSGSQIVYDAGVVSVDINELIPLGGALRKLQ